MSSLPYHRRVADHFREQKKTWEFFASARTRSEQLQQFKLDLLKNTYQFDPAADARIYGMVDEAREKLGLKDVKVVVYQATFSEETNASIAWLEGEAHVVFSGRVTGSLSDEELLAVIAHELAHIRLFTIEGGIYETADRIILSIANHPGSEAAHVETARLFRLYTEIFCDRGAAQVLGKTGPVITSLVKVATGLDKVSAESYLRQADEIFSIDKENKTGGLSHPENYIRARALQLWFDKGEEAEAEIIRMIEGQMDLDSLDLFRQEELSKLTRRFLQLYLKPRWFRTVAVLSGAKQFFTDFTVDDAAVLDEAFRNRMQELPKGIRDYFAALLLDFALLDPALELVPFGWAFQLSDELGLKDAFATLVRKELQLSEKKLAQHRDKSLAAYQEVKEGADESVYEE